jgi:phage protein D
MSPIASPERQRQPVECVVKVDDVEITEFYPFLREVQVSMSRRAATTATLAFDSVRLENGSWKVQDAGLFMPWRRIRIDAVFGLQSEEVMRGFIKEVRCEYPEDKSAAKVTLSAQDESLALDRQQVTNPISTQDAPKSDKEIVEQIAAAHGLETDVETGLTNAALNFDGTEVRLLQSRAEANGHEFYVRAGKLCFHAPRLDQNAVDEPIRVYAGADTNCLRFSSSFDGHKPDIVTVMRASETDPQNPDQEDFKPNLRQLGTTPASSEESGLPSFASKIPAPTGGTPEEAHARAQAKANENAWKISAEGELDGALYGHVLLTHTLVVVDGAGETYGGTYYVDEVQHRFSTDGYRQGFKLLRNATGEEGMPGAASALAPVLGTFGMFGMR